MERYLLFDSACAKCTKVADQIEELAGGWLTTRSLRDPGTRKLLKEVHPGWRWQPMILEQIGDRSRIYSGFSLSLRLIIKLGILKALKIARLLLNSDTTASRQTPADPSRRNFVRQSGLAFSAFALLFGFPTLRPEVARAQNRSSQPRGGANQPTPSESNANFVILPDGVAIPAFVQEPRLGMPQICGVGGAIPTVINDFPTSLSELVADVALPIFTISDEKRDNDSFSAYVMSHLTGEVFIATHSFKVPEIEANVRFSAQPDFHRPYPVYRVDPVEEGHDPVIPERINFLPGIGLIVIGPVDSSLMWIKDDILYSATIDKPITVDTAENLAQSFVVAH